MRLNELQNAIQAADLMMQMSSSAKPEVQRAAIERYRSIKQKAIEPGPQWSPEKLMMRHIRGIDRFEELEAIVARIESNLSQE